MAFDRRFAGLVALGGVALAVVAPLAAQRAPTSGPIARYDIRAGTVLGTTAMGGGVGGAMGMMFGGGGGKIQHELYLRLGSSQSPAGGGPHADHFMPAGARLGKSVALVTPVEERGPADELPGQRDGRRPSGRMLLFWGCGEHAPKGQPVVIDLAHLAAGQVPKGLWSSSVARDWGPTPGNSHSFGRWPADDGKFVKADSSLIGAHRVVGNYSPAIAFTARQDFLAALSASNAAQPSGAALLSWNAVPAATGYLATLFGGKSGPGGQMGDMVMWTSSAGRQFGGGLSDWLTPGQVAPLVRDRTVMSPATTSCMIPAEVRNAAPNFRMGTLIAYGPEENFAYPPRPADPKAAWNLEWTVRIRHRSNTSWMDMPAMQGMGGPEADTTQPPAQTSCKPKGGFGGMGGLLGKVLKPGC